MNKQIFVRTSAKSKWNNLTALKEYEAEYFEGGAYYIVDDDGDRILIYIQGCAFLENDAPWEIVE